MKRFLYEKLVEWKHSKWRKPLILEGARQVGKTWLLKQFGQSEYKHLVYINCDNNPQFEMIFADYDINRIIRNLSALSNKPILPGKTLIVFDEIQEMPKALTSLKYFCEDAPQIHVAVAGSLLGLFDHHGSGFPVGKVDTLSLYPLSFMEFLDALGKDILIKQIREHKWEELNALNPMLTELLRQYFFTGGMPEVVESYVTNHDLKRVRAIQENILEGYRQDFSKHASKTDIEKISLVFRSIPSQLAKENKKYIYSAVKNGGRAKEFEGAIQWLINAGFVHKVNRAKSIGMPLSFYEDFNCFKLFLNDLGLLGAMSDAPPAEILIGNGAFSSYQGSFTEQFVAQQFFSAVGKNLYYYTNDNSTMEIDFLTQNESVMPIEVKAGINLKSKSLSTVLKNNSELFGIRFSMADYKIQGQMVNVPLALSEEYFREIFKR
ncbi:ATP-binding protein [bacterium]|nr:ATP-binding protein [bacterium]